MLSNLFFPSLELVRLRVNSLLVNVRIFVNVGRELVELLLKVDAKLVTVDVVNVCTKRPDDREGDIVVDNFVGINLVAIELDSILV